MKKLYLVEYKIVDGTVPLWTGEDTKSVWIPVNAEDSSVAIFKLKSHLIKEGQIGKKSGRKVEILSVTKEI